MEERIRSITATGMLFALALILSLVEGALPALPMLPPGIKPGLSNIVVMYCLLCHGPGQAGLLVLLKAGFAFLTRGGLAGLLSLSGGLLSIFTMLLLMLPKRHMASVFLLSVFGAVGHNVGQLSIAALWLGQPAVMAYFPLLLLGGALMGILTGSMLKILLPAMERAEQGINLTKRSILK